MNSKHREALLVVTLVASSFLALYFFSSYVHDFQGTDSMIYAIAARSFLEKGTLKSNFVWGVWTGWVMKGVVPNAIEWNNSPLYILMVALFFRIFGISFRSMQLLSVTIGALSIVPLFFTVKKLLGKEKAVVACLVYLMYPLMMVSEIVPTDKIFDAFMVISAIMFVSLGAKFRHILAGGILCGLLFLTRYDFGGAVFIASYVFYSVQTRSQNETLRKRLLFLGTFVVSFALSILPWAVQTYKVYGYFFTLTGAVATTFTGTTFFPISPVMFLVVITLLVFLGPFIGESIAFLSKLRDKLSVKRAIALTAAIIAGITIFLVLFTQKNWLIFVITFVTYYPQLIYQSGAFIFILAGVGILINIKKIGVTHPVYTFLFIIILIYTAITWAAGGEAGLASPYVIPYIPVVVIFVGSAIVDISSAISGFSQNGQRLETSLRGLRSGRGWSTRHLVVVFLLGSIFLSFLPQYAIIMFPEKVQQGPFRLEHFDEASQWILQNTDPRDTIMARYPYVTFITGRRTIVLEPLNTMQLFTIIRAATVAYVIIDSDAYRESLSVPDSVITRLYEYPESQLFGFTSVFEQNSPTILVFDVRRISSSPMQAAWLVKNLTSGWVVDNGLTFSSNGSGIEMAYDNTAGSSAAFLYASTNVTPPVSFSEYPYMIVKYKFLHWTTSGYPPPGYFRVYWEDSTGVIHPSDQAPFPSNDNDYDYHSWVLNQGNFTDISKLSLQLRVGEGTKLSVFIDYIAISRWPFLGE